MATWHVYVTLCLVNTERRTARPYVRRIAAPAANKPPV